MFCEAVIVLQCLKNNTWVVLYLCGANNQHSRLCNAFLLVNGDLGRLFSTTAANSIEIHFACWGVCLYYDLQCIYLIHIHVSKHYSSI